MLKQIYFFVAILFISTIASAMSYQDQINHIRSQMQALQRAWKGERIHIKQAQKASPTLYQTLTNTFDKILTHTSFTSRLETTVSSQFDSIVNNNMSFNSVKTEFNLSDFFPNLTMHDFGKKLFSAMANKMAYLELGKKLAQKLQELKIMANTQTTTSA